MSVRDYVTVRVSGQLFGIEAAAVQDVFLPRAVTPVPLANPEIVGVLNLRGRIVTAVCARRRLGLPPLPAGAPEPKAVGIEIRGDSYGLVVDAVEAVIKLETDELISPPGALPARWAEIISAVSRLENELLVVFDVGRLLIAELNPSSLGAAA